MEQTGANKCYSSSEVKKGRSTRMTSDPSIIGTGNEDSITVKCDDSTVISPTEMEPTNISTGKELDSYDNSTAISGAAERSTAETGQPRTGTAKPGTQATEKSDLTNRSETVRTGQRGILKSTKQSNTRASTGQVKHMTTPKPGDEHIKTAVRGILVPRAPFDHETTGRRLLMVRHAEDLDKIFPGWMRLAYATGRYQPYDLNQPLKLPQRHNGPADFENDAPITEIGQISSQLVGRALGINKDVPTAIYSSPALRCVQTANSLFKNSPIKIRIEPGLFEWMRWYETPPQWMAPQQFRDVGYFVETSYKPTMETEGLLKCKKETSFDHFVRTFNTVESILNQNRQPGMVLIVAHATTIDAVVRPLLGFGTETMDRTEMDRMGLHYPNGCCVALEELKTGAWRMIKNAVPSISYLDFTNRIDYHYLHRSSRASAQILFNPTPVTDVQTGLERIQSSKLSIRTGLEESKTTINPSVLAASTIRSQYFIDNTTSSVKTGHSLRSRPFGPTDKTAEMLSSSRLSAVDTTNWLNFEDLTTHTGKPTEDDNTQMTTKSEDSTIHTGKPTDYDDMKTAAKYEDSTIHTGKPTEYDDPKTAEVNATIHTGKPTEYDDPKTAEINAKTGLSIERKRKRHRRPQVTAKKTVPTYSF